MSLHFIKAGLQTSLQDLGRFGQMHNGISQSGAMDLLAMQMANWLLSKPLDAAVIEISLIGPTIRFESAMSVAICGAQFDLYLNGSKLFNDETIRVTTGDILKFDKLKSGARAYLAFSGQINIAPVLSSYATHLTANFGGYHGRSFQAGDRLEINLLKQPQHKKIPTGFHTVYSGNYLLRTVASVETDSFSPLQRDIFFGQSFKVTSESNRMGIRLAGEPLSFEKNIEITSSGMTQGSIQIPPSGQPIISSVDGQTIGGYPRIANVITADLPILGQLTANDKIRFGLINQNLARAILNKKQSRLDWLFCQSKT